MLAIYVNLYKTAVRSKGVLAPRLKQAMRHDSRQLLLSVVVERNLWPYILEPVH